MSKIEYDLKYNTVCSVSKGVITGSLFAHHPKSLIPSLSGQASSLSITPFLSFPLKEWPVLPYAVTESNQESSLPLLNI